MMATRIIPARKATMPMTAADRSTANVSISPMALGRISTSEMNIIAPALAPSAKLRKPG